MDAIKWSVDWHDQIKQLKSQNADMAIIDMSITYIQETTVDFTMPYM